MYAPSNIDALAVRQGLNDHDGPRAWGEPQQWGLDGWAFLHRDGRRSCMVTCAPQDDGHEWIHASITGDGDVPDYDALKALHQAVWGDEGWAYQVFAPASDHVNIHEHALHLWGRLDGEPALPDFTHGLGTI